MTEATDLNIGTSVHKCSDIPVATVMSINKDSVCNSGPINSLKETSFVIPSTMNCEEECIANLVNTLLY